MNSDPATELQCVLLRDTLRSPQDRLKVVFLSKPELIRCRVFAVKFSCQTPTPTKLVALRMLFRNVATWPDVDLSEAEWPGPGPGVNFLAQDFHAKGNAMVLVRDPSLDLSDPPRENSMLTSDTGMAVVHASATKFDVLLTSAENVDDTGFCVV